MMCSPGGIQLRMIRTSLPLRIQEYSLSAQRVFISKESFVRTDHFSSSPFFSLPITPVHCLLPDRFRSPHILAGRLVPPAQRPPPFLAEEPAFMWLLRTAGLNEIL